MENKIEFTEPDRNIIRFCVEDRLKQELEKEGLQKLKYCKKYMQNFKLLEKDRTNEKSLFI